MKKDVVFCQWSPWWIPVGGFSKAENHQVSPLQAMDHRSKFQWIFAGI
jgi:hypothetical protein